MVSSYQDTEDVVAIPLVVKWCIYAYLWFGFGVCWALSLRLCLAASGNFLQETKELTWTMGDPWHIESFFWHTILNRTPNLVQSPLIDLSCCCYSAVSYKPMMVSESASLFQMCALSHSYNLEMRLLSQAVLPFSKCSHHNLTLFMVMLEERIDFNPLRKQYTFEWFVWLQ